MRKAAAHERLDLAARFSQWFERLPLAAGTDGIDAAPELHLPANACTAQLSSRMVAPGNRSWQRNTGCEPSSFAQIAAVLCAAVFYLLLFQDQPAFRPSLLAQPSQYSSKLSWGGLPRIANGAGRACTQTH